MLAHNTHEIIFIILLSLLVVNVSCGGGEQMPNQCHRPPHVIVSCAVLARPMAASTKGSSCCVSISVSSGCSFLGKLCLLTLSEHSSAGASVSPSASQYESGSSRSMSMGLWGGLLMISSHVNPSSKGGVRQRNQSLCSGLSHFSESEDDFQLSESVSSLAGQLQTSMGDCVLGGSPLEWGQGNMLLKSFADLSSTDVREDDTALMGTHSVKFIAGLYTLYSSTHAELP